MKNTNYFELFKLKTSFKIDMNDLNARYRSMARRVHPDSFGSFSKENQEVSVEDFSILNDAFRTLKDSSKRAFYLLKLKDQRLPLEDTVQDTEFLLQQMEWYEKLEEMKNKGSLKDLKEFEKELENIKEELNSRFCLCWEDNARLEEAKIIMRRMQFIDKITKETKKHINSQT